MPVKYWDGSQWVMLSQSQVKDYDGSSFAAVNDASVYDGSGFQSLFGSGGGGGSVIDDFEDGSISEYSGSTGSFAVVSSPVQNGSNALEMSNGSNAAINSNSGLDVYPQQGDTFRGWMRTSSNLNAAAVMFGYGTPNHTPSNNLQGYLPTISEGDNTFKLVLYDGSSWTTLGSASHSLSEGTWYEFEVQWTTGDEHTITWYDSAGSQIATIGPVTDGTYTSGGVGWRISPASGTPTAYGDYVRLI